VLKELDIVKLVHDLPVRGLRKGARGTIVHRYRDGGALEVEFLDSRGETIAVETLSPNDVMPAKDSHVSVAREECQSYSPTRNVRVVYQRADRKWVNVRAGASKASSIHDTQREAEEAARRMLSKSGGGNLAMKRRDGTVGTNYAVHGRGSKSSRGATR
jgi:hypothetical protein